MNHISPMTTPRTGSRSPLVVLLLLLALPGGPEPQFRHLRPQLRQLALQHRLPRLGRQQLLEKGREQVTGRDGGSSADSGPMLTS